MQFKETGVCHSCHHVPQNCGCKPPAPKPDVVLPAPPRDCPPPPPPMFDHIEHRHVPPYPQLGRSVVYNNTSVLQAITAGNLAIIKAVETNNETLVKSLEKSNTSLVTSLTEALSTIATKINEVNKEVEKVKDNQHIDHCKNFNITRIYKGDDGRVAVVLNDCTYLYADASVLDSSVHDQLSGKLVKLLDPSLFTVNEKGLITLNTEEVVNTDGSTHVTFGLVKGQ